MTEPNWKPLEAVIPAADCGDWMWMDRGEHDGHTIEHYKHRNTRGYLNLDESGNAWQARTIEYGCPPWCDEQHEHRQDVWVMEQVPLAEAIEQALL
ncbi:hypothetical protein [Polymorphospora lycopeni]|uniref:Uncharacterized protein n=1 Tax=Polymorphospora lycopeni TaxID=3140240 RepID=A0ABV5CKQ1_9ACTN